MKARTFIPEFDPLLTQRRGEDAVISWTLYLAITAYRQACAEKIAASEALKEATEAHGTAEDRDRKALDRVGETRRALDDAIRKGL